jgi:hypothetical protein
MLWRPRERRVLIRCIGVRNIGPRDNHADRASLLEFGRPSSRSSFQTNPIDLDKLLEDCHRGSLQLPDFQRSWVWDEERIKSLIASISRAFPIGALMSSA